MIKVKNKIIEFLQRTSPEFVSHPEYEAALSHFLQNPNVCPPFMNHNLFRECKDLLTAKSKRSSNSPRKIAESSTEYQPEFCALEEKIPFPEPKNSRFNFIDLFCGIGGFRIAMQNAGGKCLFSSDWDKYSKITYTANFGEKPYGDIHKIAVADIPKHDILCAGFPCQPFSIAGVSKKNSLGRKHGFEDEKQGNLFFTIAEILDYHKPSAFILENVKNLKSHDGGHTFEVIYRTLTEALGYQVYYQIVDAKCFVPQHRERIFLVGFKPKREFKFPEFPILGPKLSTILDSVVPDKYTLTDHLWQYLQNYAKKHREAGNGFGFGLVEGKDIARTLSARYYKDGSEILISQCNRKNPRRLTPRECARLMGYPESFKIPVSDTQAYRQFGNSVVVPVVENISKVVTEALKNEANYAPALVAEAPVDYGIKVPRKNSRKSGRKESK
jgi:DNA (cytosine-5)-methyltransferase 1